MPVSREFSKNIPWSYVRIRPPASELAEQYILEWEKKRNIIKNPGTQQETIRPNVCFSRRVGVGAIEVADLLGAKTGYKVVDKEIIEYIAKRGGLSEKTVAIFDEHYPGKLNEFLYSFGEKGFIQSDYSRHLFEIVLTVAGLGPTIFIGRGAHLLLPRDKVLAVRFTASMEHRIKRVTNVLDMSNKKIIRKLELFDKEQNDFCKKVYGRDWQDTEHFDLVINFDRFSDPQWAVEVIDMAFKQKFGIEMKNVK